uniref:Uncharacterized protein n=1 Tax=Cannabis sativa TaxID=3483 RepID=A0A803NFV1_CANSA
MIHDIAEEACEVFDRIYGITNKGYEIVAAVSPFAIEEGIGEVSVKLKWSPLSRSDWCGLSQMVAMVAVVTVLDSLVGFNGYFNENQ